MLKKISGGTALIAAAARGDLAIVRTLLQVGADVNREIKRINGDLAGLEK